MMHLSCAGRLVADYQVRPDLALSLSPRPYLHPVRTLAGVRVTDAVPRDHPWHLGVSVAIQHVEHVQQRQRRTANFWGGRTYLREEGYTWLEDHGRVEHLRWIERSPSAFTEELSWRVPGSPAVLRERRSVAVAPLRLNGSAEARPAIWTLRMRFRLENLTGDLVRLGSPGTHGRSEAGYGGFFWRAAASEGEMRVTTPDAVGEPAVHGRPADWLVLGGNEPGTGRTWSLLLAGTDAATRADPWFVRTKDYPGVGSALAYERPVEIEPGEVVSRSLLVAVADGVLDAAAASRVLSTARGQ